MKAFVRLSQPIGSREAAPLAAKAMANIERLVFTGTLKEDITEQVITSVRVAYSTAAVAVASAMPQAMRADVAESMANSLADHRHVAHIEWEDGTSEALVVPLDLHLVAQSTAAYMIHRRFSEGVNIS